MPKGKSVPNKPQLQEDSQDYHYGHESRIQRLEDNHTDLSGRVASLTSRIDSGFDRIDTKFDDLAEPIHKVVAQVSNNSDYINRLQEKELVAQQRWSTAQKILWAFIVAVAGVAGKELGVYLYHLLKHV